MAYYKKSTTTSIFSSNHIVQRRCWTCFVTRTRMNLSAVDDIYCRFFLLKDLHLCSHQQWHLCNIFIFVVLVALKRERPHQHTHTHTHTHTWYWQSLTLKRSRILEIGAPLVHWKVCTLGMTISLNLSRRTFMWVSCGFHVTYRVSICEVCLWEEKKVFLQCSGNKNKSILYNLNKKMWL